MSRLISLASCFSPRALCSCCTVYVQASPVEWPALDPKWLSEISHIEYADLMILVDSCSGQ